MWLLIHDRGGGGWGGALPFVPHFRYLDDLFTPTTHTHKFDHVYHFIQILLGPISKAPHFQHVDDLFAPQNWPNLSFYSDLVGSHFELRAAHPYWLYPECTHPMASPISVVNWLIPGRCGCRFKDVIIAMILQWLVFIQLGLLPITNLIKFQWLFDRNQAYIYMEFAWNIPWNSMGFWPVRVSVPYD